MPTNENDFMNDGFLSEENGTGGTGGNSGYVPRFERDLKKAGGDLSVLAKEKAGDGKDSDSIDKETDVSSLKNEAGQTAVSGSPDVIGEFEIEVENLPSPEEELAEQSAQPDEADIDFIYGEDENYDYTGSLEDISADSIALDSIDVKIEDMRTDKSSIISSLKNQMQADDLAMSVENRPKIDEMSETWFTDPVRDRCRSCEKRSRIRYYGIGLHRLIELWPGLNIALPFPAGGPAVRK